MSSVTCPSGATVLAAALLRARAFCLLPCMSCLLHCSGDRPARDRAESGFPAGTADTVQPPIAANTDSGYGDPMAGRFDRLDNPEVADHVFFPRPDPWGEPPAGSTDLQIPVDREVLR